MSLLTLACLLASSLVVTTPYAGAATAHAPVRMPDLVGRSRAQLYAIMRHDALYFNTRGPGSSNASWRTVGNVFDTRAFSKTLPPPPASGPRTLLLKHADGYREDDRLDRAARGIA